MAILWHGLFCVPFANNPFARRALNEFCGMNVADKWFDRLGQYLDPLRAYTMANALSLASLIQQKDWMIGKTLGTLGKAFFTSATGIMAGILAYQFCIAVALVSCDMAFEEQL